MLSYSDHQEVNAYNNTYMWCDYDIPYTENLGHEPNPSSRLMTSFTETKERHELYRTEQLIIAID